MTPFNQADFATLSLLAMYIAGCAISLDLVRINREIEPDGPPGYEEWLENYWKGRTRPGS